MEITGTLPSILANKLEEFNGNLDNIIIKGNDINVDFNEGDNLTHLEAVWLGNGTWEISELDDGVNLFPEYDVADVVSADIISKVLLKSITSGLILSFNPLGKIKYGVADVAKKVGKAVKKAGKWAFDIMSAEDAQNWIRKQKGHANENVGPCVRMPGATGGYYKVISGNPDDGTYSVWKLYKNGNEYRTLKAWNGLDQESAVNQFDELGGKTYAEYSMTGNEEDNVSEGQEVEETQEEFDNMNPDTWSEDEEDNVSEGQEEDGDELAAMMSSKKPSRKKSKYNGLNVTGCTESDGSVALASNLKLLKNESDFISTL